MAKPVQIQISSSCYERFENMTATTCGAFCKSCNKQVTDFTGLTENEIYNLVTSARRPLCGRFSAEQLNRPIRKTELHNSFFNWKAALASLAAFFSGEEMYANHDLGEKPKTIITQKSLSDTAACVAAVEE